MVNKLKAWVARIEEFKHHQLEIKRTRFLRMVVTTIITFSRTIIIDSCKIFDNSMVIYINKRVIRTSFIKCTPNK